MDKFNLLTLFKQSIITYLQNGGRARKLSFTMAEILLSLTIIGVVAAITLPSLTGNINERTWNTQRKALYARMSQAIALMGSLNGYGQYSGTWSADSVTVTTDTAAQTFVTEGLAKVLKINNICDAEHFTDCGINSVIITMRASKVNFPKKMSELNPMFISTYSETGYSTRNSQSNIDTKAAAFETQNGESIVAFYNPYCGSANMRYNDSVNASWAAGAVVYNMMCVNFIYDLNGKKGPNTMGKDIGFMTALYPSDSVVVAPMPLGNDSKSLSGSDKMSQAEAVRTCTALGEDVRLPNIDELSSMFYNGPLLNLTRSWYWSVNRYNDEDSWGHAFHHGKRQTFSKDRSDYLYVRCVKR